MPSSPPLTRSPIISASVIEHVTNPPLYAGFSRYRYDSCATALDPNRPILIAMQNSGRCVGYIFNVGKLLWEGLRTPRPWYIRPSAYPRLPKSPPIRLSSPYFARRNPNHLLSPRSYSSTSSSSSLFLTFCARILRTSVDSKNFCSSISRNLPPPDGPASG